MSAVPATRPTHTERPQTRPAARPRPLPPVELRTRIEPVPVRPVTTARPATRPRKARAKARVAIPPVAIVKAMGMAAIAVLTFSVSSLTGHVMVEKARREGLRAADRARVARGSEALIRARVDALTAEPSVEKWALASGFIPPDEIAKPGQETRVATRR